MKANEVIQKLIDQIEAGCAAWQLPWSAASSSGLPTNALTKKAYQGTNILAFWAAQAVRGYRHGLWVGYEQAKALGGRVRIEELSKKSCGIVYRHYEKEQDDGSVKTMAYATSFNVFNIEQCDGLEHLLPTFEKHDWNPIESAETLVNETGATITYGGDRAFYAPLQDVIRLPERERFKTAEDFYATAIHELGHWTGHQSRLNREFGKKFGNEAYAFEELVAEIACAITRARIGLQGEVQHASYLEFWLKILKQQPRHLLTAASMAQKASDFITKENTNEPV